MSNRSKTGDDFWQRSALAAQAAAKAEMTPVTEEEMKALLDEPIVFGKKHRGSLWKEVCCSDFGWVEWFLLVNQNDPVRKRNRRTKVLEAIVAKIKKTTLKNVSKSK